MTDTLSLEPYVDPAYLEKNPYIQRVLDGIDRGRLIVDEKSHAYIDLSPFSDEARKFLKETIISKHMEGSSDDDFPGISRSGISLGRAIEEAGFFILLALSPVKYGPEKIHVKVEKPTPEIKEALEESDVSWSEVDPVDQLVELVDTGIVSGVQLAGLTEEQREQIKENIRSKYEGADQEEVDLIMKTQKEINEFLKKYNIEINTIPAIKGEYIEDSVDATPTFSGGKIYMDIVISRDASLQEGNALEALSDETESVVEAIGEVISSCDLNKEYERFLSRMDLRCSDHNTNEYEQDQPAFINSW